jgi:hypothetical protein
MRAWAAVTALGGALADSADAQTLRAELGLVANPWQVDRALEEARRDRLALINWLLRCDPPGDDGLPPRHSLVWRALNWWRRRYREAAHKKKNEENPLLPWKESLASRRWKLEQALLQLYSEPESAAEHLAQLADDELREEVRERLSEFAAAEHRPNGSGDDAYIYLTWRLDELRGQTPYHLRRLGFAADFYPYEPPSLEHYASRLVLAVSALSALSALALAAFVAARLQGISSPSSAAYNREWRHRTCGRDRADRKSSGTARRRPLPGDRGQCTVGDCPGERARAGDLALGWGR